LPIDDIQKIEVKRIEDEKVVTVTNISIITSLVSQFYKSGPIEIDDPNISKGLFYVRIYYKGGLCAMLVILLIPWL
jgi:hypothetical protein